jgi:antitoxin component YwqK of YwqJK toxin-antitoxin module
MLVYTTGITHNINVLVTIEVDETNVKPQNPDIFDKANATYNISTGKIVKIIDENCKEYNIVTLKNISYFQRDYNLGEQINKEIPIFLTKAKALNNQIPKNYTGTHTSYHTNGRISKIVNYSNGYEGIEKEFFDMNGLLIFKSNFINDNADIICAKTYYPNGILQEESYRNYLNQLDGDYKTYDKEGNLVSHKVFQKGKLVNTLINLTNPTNPTNPNEKIFTDTETYYNKIFTEENPNLKDTIVQNIKYFLKQVEIVETVVINNKRSLKIRIAILLFQYLNLDYIVNFIISQPNFKQTVLRKIEDFISEPINSDEVRKLIELCDMLKNKLIIQQEIQLCE